MIMRRGVFAGCRRNKKASLLERSRNFAVVVTSATAAQGLLSYLLAKKRVFGAGLAMMFGATSVESMEPTTKSCFGFGPGG
jgi:hypothetical protein